MTGVQTCALPIWKPIRVKAWRGHHLEIKSQRRIRRYAGKAVLGSTHANQVTRLLPYGG